MLSQYSVFTQIHFQEPKKISSSYEKFVRKSLWFFFLIFFFFIFEKKNIILYKRDVKSCKWHLKWHREQRERKYIICLYVQNGVNKSFWMFLLYINFFWEQKKGNSCKQYQNRDEQGNKMVFCILIIYMEKGKGRGTGLGSYKNMSERWFLWYFFLMRNVFYVKFGYLDFFVWKCLFDCIQKMQI